MKVIELVFEDGERWQIPLQFIAENRADYYETKQEDDFNYKSEVEYVMNDDYEGIDWLQNNMDFEDFKNVLVVLPPETKQTKDWCNAEFEIKEIKENEQEN